jgi:hypothetical protein
MTNISAEQSAKPEIARLEAEIERLTKTLEQATTLSDPYLKRRAELCVTHHMACDCREAMLQQQALDRDAEIERLHARTFQTCHNCGAVVEIEHD